MIEFIMAFVALQPSSENESLRDTLKRTAQALPEGERHEELMRLEMLLSEKPL